MKGKFSSDSSLVTNLAKSRNECHRKHAKRAQGKKRTLDIMQNEGARGMVGVLPATPPVHPCLPPITHALKWILLQVTRSSQQPLMDTCHMSKCHPVERESPNLRSVEKNCLRKIANDIRKKNSISYLNKMLESIKGHGNEFLIEIYCQVLTRKKKGEVKVFRLFFDLVLLY